MSRFSGATFRLLVDDPGEIGLAAEQLAEIDNVENEQRAMPRRHNCGVARTAGEQCHLAKELARPENDRFGPHLYFDLS